VGTAPVQAPKENQTVGAPGQTSIDALAILLALALIAVAAVVGHQLNRAGRPIVLPSPPLIAYWSPHVGWGTPLALACLLFGLRLQRAAIVLTWRRLLLAGWLLNLAWMISLILIDGLRRGWFDVLLDPNEYLHDLPRITDPLAFLATFTDYIAFGNGVDGSTVWTTHVAGHPPLATLLFWGLDRVGLSGGFWAGAMCILASSAVSIALPVVVRELGAGSAARRLVPFVALFPGAVWMAVSADGLFAGVAISGLALVCVGAMRRRRLVGFVGGLLLGAAVFLSYGLVLFGLVVVVPVILTIRGRGWRTTVGSWTLAMAGAAIVVGVHAALGFNWLTGLAQLRIRYYQGIAAQRPFSYFVYANLAAWLISCSPLLAVGISRSIGVLRGGRHTWSADHVVAWLALSGVLAAVVADLSALSKAETERIWLTFGAIAYAGLALLRGRQSACALVGCAATALLVNHLFNTGW
jgi:hypothetical protein